jgi:hypothetical protein
MRNSKFPSEVFERVTFKKGSMRLSRDGYAIYADVYFDNKYVVSIEDAGCGGEINLFNAKIPKNRDYSILENYLRSLNVDKIMFETSFKFMKSAEKIHLAFMLDVIFTEQYEYKKVSKKFKNTIVVYNPNESSYTEYKFNMNLDTLPKQYLQDNYNEIKSKLKPNSIILNDNLVGIVL